MENEESDSARSQWNQAVQGQPSGGGTRRNEMTSSNHLRLSRLRCVAAALLVSAFVARPGSAADTCSRSPVDTLSIRGDELVIDGTAEFLPFVTYFDALRATEAQWDADLNYFCAHGIRGVRIFANWRVGAAPQSTISTILNPDGTLVQESRVEGNGQRLFRAVSVLDQFLDTARSKGIVVELVFDSDTGLSSRNAWASGVLNVVSRYAGSRRHLLLDVANEYPAHDLKPCDIASLLSGSTIEMPAYGPSCVGSLTVSTNIRAIDPQRIVTASADPGGIVHVFRVPESRVSPVAAAATYASLMGLDIVTFHDGRPGNPGETPGWAARTGEIVDALRAHAGERARPIFLDEPCRVGNTASTRHCPKTAAPYVQAAAQAREHGAAAWTYHTETGMGPYAAGRSFITGARGSAVDSGVIGVPLDNGARKPLAIRR